MNLRIYYSKQLKRYCLKNIFLNTFLTIFTELFYSTKEKIYKFCKTFLTNTYLKIVKG